MRGNGSPVPAARMSRTVTGPRLAALAVAGVLAVSGLSAQARAVLDIGPELRSGVPYLSANVLSYYHGEYDLGEITVIVDHVSGEVPVPEAAEIVRCGAVGLSVLPSRSARILYLRRGGDIIFFVFPDGYDAACGFVERFLVRFDYFTRAAPDSRIPPYPAVLELAD